MRSRHPLMTALLVLLCSILTVSVQAQSSGTPTPAYNYPQPALPSNWAVRDPSTWTLSPDFEITDEPTTREYWWEVAKAAASPDGYPRQIYAINGLFPGPLIEANEGDEVVVHLTNHLDIGMTIHWHGMYMNGTQFMDGVPGVSQCPIGPGVTFTYRFTVANQYGSYWWHSHYGNTLADGIVGSLIVHSTRDPLVRGRDFDEETIVMVQDWMDLQSESVVEGMHSATGYRGKIGPPQGDSILINGLGRTNCSNEDIQDHAVHCDPPLPPEINVKAGKKIKLRILNVGSYGMFRISIDTHPFEVVEIDDAAVYGPSNIHEIQVGTGQRTSIVINTDKGKAGHGWYLRANIVTDCIGQSGKVQTGLAVLRYVDDKGNSPSTLAPDTKAWDDLQGQAAKCQDIDEEYDIKPREARDAPNDILQTHVMSSAIGNFVGKDGKKIGPFGFNNITYQAQVGYPLLHQVQEGHNISDIYVAHATYDKMGWGDLIINNLDAGISHPYHLHGKPFAIVARGVGNITAQEWEKRRGKEAKVTNPLRRDVIEIRGGSWAVLRIYIDLPGVWPLHCHIGWHLSEGKLAAIVYQPEAIRSIAQPEDWKNLCSAYGKDEIGPAKRRSVDEDEVEGREALTLFEMDLAAQRKHEDEEPASTWPRLIRRGSRE